MDRDRESDQDFEEIVNANKVFVFRVLFRLIKDQQQLEDLAQEVFLRLFRGMKHFRGSSLLSTYLYRICINVARDSHVKSKKSRMCDSLSDPDSRWEESLQSAGPTVDQILDSKEGWERLQHSLAALRGPEREVILLYYEEDCSYEQIARIMNIPIGTVKTHLYRARKHLKNNLFR
jgi:RNA polymerase sigma-70 factor (ECF subfamily)